MSEAYRVDILTLFPEAVSAMMDSSIIGRAQKAGKVIVNSIQIRDFTENKQKQVDDYPYGGGLGLIMNAQPLKSCLDSVIAANPDRKRRVIYLSPQGEVFNQETAKRLVKDYNQLILVCGHYEGVDERFIESCVDEEISLGDFVISGGEIAAMAVADAVLRMIPGVLREENCFVGESHWDGLLEYPQYTRPYVWEGMKVPSVLLSGNHREIERWRRREQLVRTSRKRPDLLEGKTLSDEDLLLLKNEELKNEEKTDFRPASAEDLLYIENLCLDTAEAIGEKVDYEFIQSLESELKAGRGWIFQTELLDIGYLGMGEKEFFEIEFYDGVIAPIRDICALISHIILQAEFRCENYALEMIQFAEELALGMAKNEILILTRENDTFLRELISDLGYYSIGMIKGEDESDLRLVYNKNVR